MYIPKISIIVPVYNVEQYISICIESIINQTFKDFELILIDDGSTDNSKNICMKYMKLDKRIYLIEQSNKGVSSARNKGIEKAVGKYIMFCDSDDWIENDCLENLYNKIISYENIDIAFAGAYRDIYLKNKKIMNKIEGISEEIYININDLNEYLKYLYESFLSVFQAPWSKLYSSELIKTNNLYFNENMVCYEDFDFNLRCLYYSRNIILTKFISYHYRGFLNEGGISRRKKNDLVYEISTVHYSINKLLKKIHAEDYLLDYIESTFIDMYNLVLKKVIIEEKNIDSNERNSILIHLFTDNEFIKFFDAKKQSIRFYRIVKKLIDLKLYNIAYFIIKKRIK